MLKRFPHSIIGLFILISLLTSGCRNDKEETQETEKKAPKVTVQITPKYGDQDFAIGEIYYDNLGHRIRVEGFSTYLSMITLKGATEATLLKDFSMHFFTSTSSSLVLNAELKEATYDSLKIGIGVPRDYNKDQDPTQYPNAHPLSVQGSQGHFWTWNTGYIFTKFEGRADLSGTEGESLLHPFAFHTGDDPLYRELALPFQVEAKSGESYMIHVILDVKKLIDNPNDQIDIEVDNVTHTAGNLPLAIRFADNFKTAFSIE